MKTTQNGYPTIDLKPLIQQAWLALQRAQRDGDNRGMARAERRMNALLERLAEPHR